MALVDIKAILATLTIVLHHLCLACFAAMVSRRRTCWATYSGSCSMVCLLFWRLRLLCQRPNARELDRQNTETLARRLPPMTRRKPVRKPNICARSLKSKWKRPRRHRDAERAVAELRKEREAREQLNQSKLEAEQDEAAKQARVAEEQAHRAIRALAQIADGDLTCRLSERYPPEYEPLRTDFNGALRNCPTCLT